MLGTTPPTRRSDRRIAQYAAYAALFFCAVALSYLAYTFFTKDRSAAHLGGAYRSVEIGGVVVRALVADTPESRALGLGGREGLAPDEGMLFVFSEDGVYPFWMKDMLFSIDMVWIASDGKVVDIRYRVPPESYPEHLTPKGPARYVLELPAGFAQAHHLALGDIVRI